MGLFDFFRKKPKASNTTTLQHVVPQKDTLNKLGVVSANKVFLDSSTHALLQNKYIAYDVETTGLNPSTDRIIELGAVIFENGMPVKSFSSLVNPGIIVPSSATAVNHITNAMLKAAPDEKSVYPEFIEFLGDAVSGNTIMCAHNARFDFDFLQNTLTRLGYDAEIKYVDTLALSRRYIPGLANYKQCTLEAHFGLKNSSSHRAEADAEMCGRILLKILGMVQEEVKKRGKSICFNSSNTGGA